MKQSFILMLFIAGCIISGYSATPEELFQTANEAYAEKEYTTAIEQYESILDKGLESANLYYNLGNAYYKTEEISSAILNYERGLKLDPAHEDLQFNLKMANLQVADEIEPLPQMMLSAWVDNITLAFSSSQWAIYLLIFLWLAVGSLTIFAFTKSMLYKKAAFITSLVLFSGALATSLFAHQRYQHERYNQHAIIFDDSVYIKSAPDEGSTDRFILHEGFKVEVLDQVGEWKKIKVANGDVGWLMAGTIKEI